MARYIRPEIIVSGVLTALIIGAGVYWMRRSGDDLLVSIADSIK